MDAFLAEHRIVLSRILLVALIVLGLMTYQPLMSPPMALIGECIGIGLLLAACLGRLWSALFIADKKTVALVTTGPYSMTRNPLYFFSYLGGLGFFLGLGQIWMMFAYSLVFAAYYRAVILHEEKVLLATHASVYHDYFTSVPRFFPRISLYQCQSVVSIEWRDFVKSFADSAWFLAVIVLVRVINHLV